STLNHILTFLPAAQRKISWEALYYSYHFRITPSDHTLVASINKVPAGHSLHCSNGKLRIKKYFDISALYTPANFLNASESELTEALNQAIAKAVKDHASCNRRIGLALSGGVDSGLIAVHLAKQNIPFKSYTFLYDGHYDELQRIERYSKHIKLDLTKIVLDTPTILKCFLEANATGSEPVSFNASLLQKMTACCQQDGVQTFFDGDGADRLFFGMNAHLRYVKMQMLYKFISEIRLNKFAGMLLQRSQIGQVQQLGNLFANWSIGIKPYPERHYDRDKPYDAAYENAIFKKYISRYWKHFQENFQSEDIRLYFAYQSIHMCPELFFYPAHEQFSRGGIENFSPFWNDEIVNLSLSMPQSWKTKQWKTKYILRKTGAQHFDPQYWTMPKIGLQNSFNYLISDKTGKEWYNTTCAAIKKTDEFIWLKEKGVEPKAERLLSFFQWRSGKGLVF
ncbi:MAG: asparagine synthetase B family protein, partial [Calditrichaeota bacterium]